MAKIQGSFVAMEFERVDIYNYVDPKTNQTKPLRSFTGLMPMGDGTVDRIRVSFPNDANYQPPNLKAGETLMFPVISTVNKRRMTVQYTLRINAPILPAPELKN